MDLATLKTWQWMAIGVVAGSAIGYAWVGAPATMPRTGDVAQFRAMVRTHAERAGQDKVERLRNVVVYPPETDPAGTLVYPVLYESLERTPAGQHRYVQNGLYAATPYVGDASILAFLDANKVPYANRVAGASRFVPAGYGAAGGLLLVGLLWPRLIRLLVAAGFVPEPVAEEKPPSLAGSWWRRAKVKAKRKPPANGVSGHDVADLNALNDDMESSLMRTARAGGSGAAGGRPAEFESTLLSGNGSRATSDPTAAAAPDESSQPKDYKGEWYPVARPTVKRDEAL